MDFDEIRKLTIVALFSDEVLMERLVLKGGNAINLIHKLGSRSSLDLDFSLDGDLSDLSDAEGRIFHALKDRFDSAGLVVFDEKLQEKPKIKGINNRPWWGGYELSFKVIEREKYNQFKSGTHAKMQINALPIGANQERVFRVDMSKNEFTDGKIKVELDYYTIYVYTLAMVVIEKLRALCQQMPDYVIKPRGNPRARDFYDVHLILTEGGVDIASPENLALARSIFAVKQVPLQLLSLIRNYREFHRPDWPAVIASVKTELNEYDFYFDYVLSQIERLKSLWVEESPL